ncbi:MAG: hypothetical protein ACKVPX_09070 [Myxococcaceae bacterium]
MSRTEDTSRLYRPVGLKELELILEAKGRAFPPRLPSQPIFYPVLNAIYAAQIAQRWSPSDEASGYAGFVTEFDVAADFVRPYEVQTVGASNHQELWIPAAQLPEFNKSLRSPIRVTHAFYGAAYQGPAPLPTMLKGVPLRRQLKLLDELAAHHAMDFACEISANLQLVFCNFGWWGSAPDQDQELAPGQRAKVLTAIRLAWGKRNEEFPLIESAELVG